MSNLFNRCRQVGVDTQVSNPKSCLILATSSIGLPIILILLKLRGQNGSYIIKTSLPGTDYSPWDQGQVNWYKIGNKVGYIPTDYIYVRAYQITFNRLTD